MITSWYVCDLTDNKMSMDKTDNKMSMDKTDNKMSNG